MDVIMKIFALLSLLLVSHAWGGWSVSSYNIRNFDHDRDAGQTNLNELGKTIREFKSDVMTFIEVVNLEAFQSVIKQNLPGYQVANSKCGGFGKQKLAIAFDTKIFTYVGQLEDLTFSGSALKCGSLRPVLLVTLQHKTTKEKYMFGAIHLKAGGGDQAMQQRWTQYELLTKLAKQYKLEKLVLMGDFNTTGYNLKNEDFDKFEKFLTSSSLSTMSENLGCTSYWEGTLGTGRHQSSILDHIVLNDGLKATVKDAFVGSHCAKLDCKDATPDELGVSYQAVSDHCPLQVTFK
jgi:endonuclease/exonuclease/phosphatase family metal-dependent hydrolase